MIPISSQLTDTESLPDLAALVLSHPGLPAKEKRSLAQLLVPPAASDPTAMFTVLARMLLGREPISAELAGQVTI